MNSVFNGIKLHPLKAMPAKMNINTLFEVKWFDNLNIVYEAIPRF